MPEEGAPGPDGVPEASPGTEVHTCPECGRELPARMMAVHRNRVHGIPLPVPPPPPPGAPDATIPPWVVPAPAPPQEVPAEGPESPGLLDGGTAEAPLPAPGPEEPVPEGPESGPVGTEEVAPEPEGSEPLLAIPPHEHDLPDHDHPFPAHDHELPAHEHDLPAHEHDPSPHEHEPYRDQLESQESDLSQLKVTLANLRQSLEEKDDEIAHLRQLAQQAEEERTQLAEEITRVQGERGNVPAGIPVVVFRTEDSAVDSVRWLPLDAKTGVGPWLGRLMEDWQAEGLGLEIAGLPPNLSVRVKGSPNPRGFEMLPSSVLFLRLSPEDRLRLASPPPAASETDPPASPDR